MKKGILIFGIGCIVLGIVCLLVGIAQDKAYEENTIECAALITDIDSSDSAASPGVSYFHTYYGKYMVNGKTYSDIKIISEIAGSKEPRYSVGQTILIEVNKQNPTQLSENGNVAYVVCCVMIASGIFFIIISRLIKK